MQARGAAKPNRFSFINGANSAYIESQYQDYLKDPESVEPSLRHFFEGYEFALSQGGGSSVPATGGSSSSLAQGSKVESYITLIRRIGHLSAHLNPLEPAPGLREEFLPENHGLSDLQAQDMFEPANLPYKEPVSWGEIQGLLLDTYCRTVGADFRDIPSVDGVAWFQHEMEGCRNKPNFSSERKLQIFHKLITAEGFEKFLGDRFLGQKRFSLEGLEAVVPMMDILTEHACDGGIEEVCIGMAHRGRLNLLANYMGKPYELMLKEFEGSDYNTHDIDGDVKYHMGYSNAIAGGQGREVLAHLLPNPSHLEAVNPVVVGFTRARQRLQGDAQRQRILPVLMHGDASFIGQGIVAETLNLSGLTSYETGGTIHLILNNQVGFTTDPEESRSCPYSSDIAKLVRAPVLHVNADDPEALVWAAELAIKYRQRFHRDVVIDIVGYRRHGHNETDEPSFTQPHMYQVIKKHKTVLTQYAERLIQEGLLTEDSFKEAKAAFRKQLQEALNAVRSEKVDWQIFKQQESRYAVVKPWQRVQDEDFFKHVGTAVAEDKLREMADKMVTLPEGFKPHAKIKKLYDTRRQMMSGAGALDWGMAELLAYGSLASEGFHVRLSGQDCRRGTFSHRQAVLKDVETGQYHQALNHITAQQADVSIINSPLSEAGVLGFEFGYSVAHEKALVIWEAQFGDFCNGAQIIIDQFLAASEAKWRQVCSLVMLLPHGYEGMGPEHSSARPERFLQLCGNNNMQVANVTTPAQFFHLLRRQLHQPFRKPLVVLTPKSLLRHPRVVSPLSAFSEGRFYELMDDTTVSPDKVERVLFCTGKIYYELLEQREQAGISNTAIIRLEQLYPFPEQAVEEVLKKYSHCREVLWTQEEPSNMGYWTFVRHRIKRFALRSASFRYCGRRGAGTTAEGSVKSHQKEQQRILDDALGIGAQAGGDSELNSGHG